MTSFIFGKVALVHYLGDDVQNCDCEENECNVPKGLQHVQIGKSVHLVAETPIILTLNFFFSQLIPTEDQVREQERSVDFVKPWDIA